MWTYLNTPFLLARSGFESEEVEPWREAGDTWRRLRVRFPEDIATHSTEQTLYFDQQGLLKRHDYDVEISGGTAAAQYADLKEFFLWHRVSDEEEDLPSPTGRPFRTRTVGRLHRSGSVCPQLRDLTAQQAACVEASMATPTATRTCSERLTVAVSALHPRRRPGPAQFLRPSRDGALA